MKPDVMQAVVWFILNNSPEIDADIQASVKTAWQKTQAVVPSYSLWHVDLYLVQHDILHTPQSSGVSTPGPDGDIYYGQLEEILELTYMGNCKDGFRNQQYILATQATQVFYLEDPARRPHWKVVEDVHHQKIWLRDVVDSDQDDGFRNQQYILATQATQVFYLEDPARRPHWKVVEDVHHQKIWLRDVVDSDQDVIHGSSMVTGETSNRALKRALRENNNQPLPIGFDYDDQDGYKAHIFPALQGRMMSGRGKASRRSTHRPVEQDYITRQHITGVLRREQQEKELFRKQAQEAQ
ncbi:hypothetical protein CTI12_AA447190 [Artemisia annua]|uniref:DUF4216 domain-containing protein n=1 Tax=Artemisia annua TaxID=35608 RepID=A0A2U1LU56_ARTAN|nr:hypothetical protein CTI12_AA447190 [Artemisia annua]